MIMTCFFKLLLFFNRITPNCWNFRKSNQNRTIILWSTTCYSNPQKVIPFCTFCKVHTPAHIRFMDLRFWCVTCYAHTTVSFDRPIAPDCWPKQHHSPTMSQHHLFCPAPLVIGDSAGRSFADGFDFRLSLEEFPHTVPQPHTQHPVPSQLQPALTLFLTSTEAPAPKSNSATSRKLL